MYCHMERRPMACLVTVRMSLYTLLIVALFHTVLCENSAQDHQDQQDRDPRRFLTKRSVRVCGVKLVDMMKKVCNHCYKTRKDQSRPLELVKRNAASEGSLRPMVAAILENEDPSSEANSVSRGLDALDMLIEKRWGGDTRRTRQQGGTGIANKCCINQCSYSDLLSYCCTSPSP